MSPGTSPVRLLLSQLVATATDAASSCISPLEYIRQESSETPFYEHYHQILVPVSALYKPTADIMIQTSEVDQGSYDQTEFETFTQSSGLKKSSLVSHRHDVHITTAQLEKIAAGETTEIRVISKAGNFVHNFLISAPPSTLARIKRNSK